MEASSDLDARYAAALQRAKALFDRTPDAAHRRLLATAANAALDDGLARERVLFWLRIAEVDLENLIKFQQRDGAGLEDARFLVQVQPPTDMHPTDAVPRRTATLIEAEDLAAEIWETMDSTGAHIFITDELNGEQRYRRPHGGWTIISGATDYTPPA